MDETKRCPAPECGKALTGHANYCGRDCIIATARAAGGEVIAPNGLPPTCIRFDGAMLEHEHADHPDYKFPVDVDGKGFPDDITAGFNEYPQSHALVYANESIAVTIYECNYAMWSLRDGEPIGGRYQREHERLSEASREKIVTWLERNRGA